MHLFLPLPLLWDLLLKSFPKYCFKFQPSLGVTTSIQLLLLSNSSQLIWDSEDTSTYQVLLSLLRSFTKMTHQIPSLPKPHFLQYHMLALLSL